MSVGSGAAKSSEISSLGRNTSLLRSSNLRCLPKVGGCGREASRESLWPPLVVGTGPLLRSSVSWSAESAVFAVSAGVSVVPALLLIAHVSDKAQVSNRAGIKAGRLTVCSIFIGKHSFCVSGDSEA